eukprot:3440201-Pleurochrysis_carterae.AAC.3
MLVRNVANSHLADASYKTSRQVLEPGNCLEIVAEDNGEKKLEQLIQRRVAAWTNRRADGHAVGRGGRLTGNGERFTANRALQHNGSREVGERARARATSTRIGSY